MFLKSQFFDDEAVSIKTGLIDRVFVGRIGSKFVSVNRGWYSERCLLLLMSCDARNLCTPRKLHCKIKRLNIPKPLWWRKFHFLIVFRKLHFNILYFPPGCFFWHFFGEQWVLIDTCSFWIRTCWCISEHLLEAPSPSTSPASPSADTSPAKSSNLLSPPSTSPTATPKEAGLWRDWSWFI